jgi:hypothetical protein
VPIQALEGALEVSFQPDDVEALDLDFDVVERLYHALLAYHRENRIQPVAGPETVRPNLTFVGFDSGVIVQRDIAPYKKGSFIPRNGSGEVPVDDIKRTLLFADAAVIEDPIFAFCRAVLCTVYMEARPPFDVLRKALTDLATFRPLLEKRLLRVTAFLPDPVENFDAGIPRGGNMICVGDVQAATSYNDERVLRLVAGKGRIPANFRSLTAEERRALIRGLMDEMDPDFRWLYRQAESLVYAGVDPDAYCPYLPGDYQLQLYKQLLRTNAVRFEDLSLQEVMDLNSGCAVEPEKIGVSELVEIRRDEEVFAKWRELIRTSVTTSDLRKGDDVSQLAAFKNEVKNKEREWTATFQQYHKGRLKDVITLSKQVSVGGLKTAAGAGAALLDPTGLTALGTVFYGLYKSARNLEKAADRKAAEAAAITFFAAVRNTAEPSA